VAVQAPAPAPKEVELPPVVAPAKVPETVLEPTSHKAKPAKHPLAAAAAGDKALGTLHLTVRGGWADVRVDGVVLGRTPTEREFQLKAGSHMLELSNPHREPFRSVVHIPPGGTLEQEVELQPQP
jgi:hypothetical protein